MKDKNLNIRLSDKTSKMIKTKSQSCGVSRARFLRIAAELVSADDVTQYLLDEINDKYERKAQAKII